MIHPTAVVDPRAELASGVSVAPYSIIGPDARIGEGSEIGAHVVLEGRVTIGARCRIGHGAIIGGAPQDLKYRDGVPVGVWIGDDTVIREYVTIHRATRAGLDTRVGDHCLVMASSHIAHDCVGGYSKVVQDVPPFVMVDGVPATARAVNVIGMRRGGVDAGGRRQVKAAFRVLYRSGLAPGVALARIKTELGGHPVVARLVESVEASRLGIVPAATGGPADAPGGGEA